MFSVANSDITVVCGTERMELQILLCPVYFGGYNESLMALNARYNNPKCHGTPDLNADPPVLKFNFSITEQAVAECSNKLTVTYIIRDIILSLALSLSHSDVFTLDAFQSSKKIQRSF